VTLGDPACNGKTEARAADSRERALSARQKRSNTCGRSVAGDPDAVVFTSPATESVLRVQPNANVTALRRVFDRIVDQAGKTKRRMAGASPEFSLLPAEFHNRAECGGFPPASFPPRTLANACATSMGCSVR